MTSQVQDKHSELLHRLAEQTEALKDSDGWKRWLQFSARFYTYSLNNQLLILSQRPDATRVAGYRVWQSLDRHVRKGEQGIAILAPIVRKREEDGEETRFIAGFRIVHVFDVSQTEGAELPTLEMPDPAVPDEHLLDVLIDVASHHGFSVDRDGETQTGARGWFSTWDDSITLVAKYSVASQTRTMLHELSHALDPDIRDPLGSRAERELVAESSAYIVGTRLGIDMDAASTLYVSSWLRDSDLMSIANKVLVVAGELEAAVRARLAV